MLSSGIFPNEDYPKTFLELKIYAQDNDWNWPEDESYPDLEFVSACAFRRFRHEFTNYDEVMDHLHGDQEAQLAAINDLVLLAHLIYPELSLAILNRFVKRKRKHLTRLYSEE